MAFQKPLQLPNRRLVFAVVAKKHVEFPIGLAGISHTIIADTFTGITLALSVKFQPPIPPLRARETAEKLIADCSTSNSDKPLKDRMPQITVISPFGELDFARQFRLQPDTSFQLVSREAIRPRACLLHNRQFCERTVSVSTPQLIKAGEKVSFGVLSEATAYATSETEITMRIVVADKQCSRADAGASNWDIAPIPITAHYGSWRG